MKQRLLVLKVREKRDLVELLRFQLRLEDIRLHIQPRYEANKLNSVHLAAVQLVMQLTEFFFILQKKAGCGGAGGEGEGGAESATNGSLILERGRKAVEEALRMNQVSEDKSDEPAPPAPTEI